MLNLLIIFFVWCLVCGFVVSLVVIFGAIRSTPQKMQSTSSRLKSRNIVNDYHIVPSTEQSQQRSLGELVKNSE